MIARDTLFISHATPQDNDFSIWLASRLEMLCYKTWIDKNGLLGGEVIWQTIQNVIKNDAIKILLVYSKNIRDTNGNLKTGIDKELSYAESIASQENITDFIIPLKIDDSQFNEFIGSNRLNHISFETNWAEGLKQLLKKLERDSVPKVPLVDKSSFSEWYENEYISNCSIIPKKELFYSSWWRVHTMPKIFYMHQFSNEKSAIEILKANKNIPVNRHSNILASFENELNYSVINDEGEKYDIVPQNTFSFSLDDILNGFNSETFPSHKDVENHFKQLLSRVIRHLFLKKRFWRADLSNRSVFYMPLYKNLKPIKFQFPFSAGKNELKRKAIWGKYLDVGNWHYAVSTKTILSPFIGFSLKSHIVFSNDGFNTISDPQKAHSYRRKKGRRFFNEEWRDMQLALMQSLRDESGEIKINVSYKGERFQMIEWPEMFWSEVGYIDPNSEMSLEKVETYFNEDDNDNDA